MAARIIDGKKVAEDIRAEVRAGTSALASRGIVPGLAVIIVGEDPASISYVTGKERACAENGLRSFEHRLPATTSQAELLATIRACNVDPDVHGVLVQLPLPDHIDEHAVMAAIDPDKDVDGFTPVNVGRLVLDHPCYVPCTPAGVVELIKRSGVPTSGRRAVIVGRSNIVGKPLMNLLVRRDLNATVTVCHTGTSDLAAHTREADILIACAGRAGLLHGDMIKKGACVIDVGVNRIEDHKSTKGFRLVGDVDFASAVEVAGWITPVPGGVGPMTITMLLANTLRSARSACGEV
ncbi:MAG TPA: bifunctional methylenetetrahydrofolate dehydrogenase/methenyltetrahydrofolate cyclohydrolase FolD [Rectinemataceae bacterium]|nr:bifunctional methylenetetrahydrofolate dehydrogenase/methenyltetrahydrofolate cyclohydrolase FolD [Rectinemataceae bacterium]